MTTDEIKRLQTPHDKTHKIINLAYAIVLAFTFLFILATFICTAYANITARSDLSLAAIRPTAEEIDAKIQQLTQKYPDLTDMDCAMIDIEVDRWLASYATQNDGDARDRADFELDQAELDQDEFDQEEFEDNRAAWLEMTSHGHID